MPELTPSTREARRRIGVSKPPCARSRPRVGSSASPTGNGMWRRPAAAWSRPPIPSDHRSLADAAFGNDLSSDTTPFARLKLAEFAVMIEARRLTLDEETSRLLDAAVATAAIDDRSGAMRDALLNWPCPHVRADRH